MLFQRALYCFAAWLALNASVVASDFDYDQLEQSIEEGVSDNSIPVCDPYLDEGCNFPSFPKVDNPIGCTDCAEGALKDLLVRDEGLALPDTVIIDGTPIDMLGTNAPSSIPTLRLPAQIGY